MPRFLAPRFWGVHLLAVVCVVAAGLLGAWQAQAWQERRAAEARDLTQVEPLPLDAVIGPDDPFPGDAVGQPVIVGGQWLPEATVLVAGREHEGRDGYWVVTPMAVSDGDAALPVVRGWTADRTPPPAPRGYGELVAWLQPTESSGPPDDDPADDVVTSLRVADLVQRVDVDLYGAYAVVAPDADDVAPGAWPVGENALNDGTEGLEPADLDQLPEASRFTALRNLLYALEWWVFGGFAVFVWWRYLRDTLAADEESAAESAPAGAG